MGNMSSYAFAANDSFASRPLGRVDSLCLSWLAYLRFPEMPDVRSREGVAISDLANPSIRSKLAAGTHNVQSSSLLLQAMAQSNRFRDVRACLYVVDSSEEEGRQFAATTFMLPDAMGSYVAFRGTDDTVLGWKENFRLACAASVPAQERAVRYVEEVACDLEGPLWIGGHSKGGNLAQYVCGMLSEEVRSRIVRCFSHDGPGLNNQARAAWCAGVPIDRTIPRDSLVGMLFERSQDDVAVVRSTAVGMRQHDPFSWEVVGSDFVYEHGLSYDAWRLSQRLNDWLEQMSDQSRESFVELLCWLTDVTGETSISGLLNRWSANAQAMRAALDAAPASDRMLFENVMDDLVATLLLGSRQELGIGVEDTPQGRAGAAARRLNDLSARVNDHLTRIDRYLG